MMNIETSSTMSLPVSDSGGICHGGWHDEERVGRYRILEAVDIP